MQADRTIFNPPVPLKPSPTVRSRRTYTAVEGRREQISNSSASLDHLFRSIVSSYQFMQADAAFVTCFIEAAQKEASKLILNQKRSRREKKSRLQTWQPRCEIRPTVDSG